MPSRAIYNDISVAEIDLALEGILKDKIVIDGIFGKKFTVPVWFRDTDANMRADNTSSMGDIFISWTSSELADGEYRIQEPICEVIESDKNGNPLKYKIIPSPTPIWNHYTITARSDDLTFIRKIQNSLEKMFPPDHRTLTINGFNTPVRRDGFFSSDLAAEGIFIREINLRILGYVFNETCETEICPAAGSLKLEIGNTMDPTEDDKFVEIDLCEFK